MRTKNISILLFFLAVAVIAALGSSPVWAQVDNCPTACTQEDQAAGKCFTVDGYVVEIVPDATTGAWPIDNGDGTITFAYKGSVCNTDACKSITWNYVIQQLPTCGSLKVDYLVSTVPTGAKLFLPGSYVSRAACPEVVAPIGFNLLKLNPALNCQSGATVQFSITTYKTTSTNECIKADRTDMWIATKTGCLHGAILGPTCGIPTAETLEYLNGYIQVTRNPCTGEPTSVTMGGEAADQCYPWICFDSPVYSQVDQKYSNCISLTDEAIGTAATGCVIRTEPYPIYGYGKTYWCPQDTSPMSLRERLIKFRTR
jgi:hypothetical protein